MEAVQCMVERRAGGESGVASVRYLEGDSVWDSRDAGEWSADLMETARGYTTTPDMPLDQVTGVGKDGDSKPGLILITYRDMQHKRRLFSDRMCNFPLINDDL